MEFSLGLVEVSALGNAIMMLDDMLKVADVEFIGVERKLGGALVTVIVRGSISSVTASVEAGRKFAEAAGVLKAAEVIARPHPEILKFLNLPENEPKEDKPKKEAKPKKAEKPEVVAEKTEEAKVEKKAEPKPVPVKKAEKKPTVKKTTKSATKTTKSKAKKA